MRPPHEGLRDHLVLRPESRPYRRSPPRGQTQPPLMMSARPLSRAVLSTQNPKELRISSIMTKFPYALCSPSLSRFVKGNYEGKYGETGGAGRAWLLRMCFLQGFLRIDSFKAFFQCVGAPIQPAFWETDKK